VTSLEALKLSVRSQSQVLSLSPDNNMNNFNKCFVESCGTVTGEAFFPTFL